MKLSLRWPMILSIVLGSSMKAMRKVRYFFSKLVEIRVDYDFLEEKKECCSCVLSIRISANLLD
jgi:hypothetical protein